MKVGEIMNRRPVTVSPEESVAVAARTLTQYNIGALPVCASDGRLCGMLTARDLVTRCMAPQKEPSRTKVSQVMTAQITSVAPELDIHVAAHLMGRLQVRRLPVTEQGRLCGMLSLEDMASREESAPDVADVLGDIWAEKHFTK